MTVIHSPVDLERFDPARYDRVAARAALGLAPDDLVLLVAAQITPWKGQDDAITATGLLRARGIPARLLLAGDVVFDDPATRHDNRTYERGLHAMVAERGLEDAVAFLGRRDDLPAVLRASDLLLAPSWEEPFGRAVAEALAMGVPVVATDAGGPREIVREGVDGLLLPPRAPERWADAIAALVAEPGRLAAMGERAREAAGRFGARRLATETVALYRSVLT